MRVSAYSDSRHSAHDSVSAPLHGPGVAHTPAHAHAGGGPKPDSISLYTAKNKVMPYSEHV